MKVTTSVVPFSVLQMKMYHRDTKITTYSEIRTEIHKSLGNCVLVQRLLVLLHSTSSFTNWIAQFEAINVGY